MAGTDSHEVSQLCELKIDLDAIAVIAHYSANSDIIMDEQMPIFGGYAGGIEETTIVDIATHINGVLICNASWHLDGSVHIRWGSPIPEKLSRLQAGHVQQFLSSQTYYQETSTTHVQAHAQRCVCSKLQPSPSLTLHQAEKYSQE